MEKGEEARVGRKLGRSRALGFDGEPFTGVLTSSFREQGFPSGGESGLCLFCGK